MSTLASISLDRPNKLEFEMEMSGNQDGEINASLAIVTPAFEISMKANIDGNNIAVDIPPMDGILFAGFYEVKLIFIVGTNYYVPFTGEIEFTKPFTVSASPVATQVAEPVVVKPIVTITPKPVVETPIEVVEDEPTSANSVAPDISTLHDPVTQSSTLNNVKSGVKKSAGSILKRLAYASSKK